MFVILVIFLVRFHFFDRDIDFNEFGLGQIKAEHESILYYQANIQQTFIDHVIVTKT